MVRGPMWAAWGPLAGLGIQLSRLSDWGPLVMALRQSVARTGVGKKNHAVVLRGLHLPGLAGMVSVEWCVTQGHGAVGVEFVELHLGLNMLRWLGSQE